MASSDRRPRRIYLDQKDWIALARARTGKDASPALRGTVKRLVDDVSTGDVVLPISETHVLETGRIGRPLQREQVASAMLLLSRRHAISPLSVIWKQEADDFFHRCLGAASTANVEPFGKGLLFALGLAADEVSVPWHDNTPDWEIALAEMFVMAEPDRLRLSSYDVGRRDRWDRWATILTKTDRELAATRAEFDEQNRLAAVTLGLLGNDLIHRAVASEVPDKFVEFTASQGPWAVVREMPSLATFTELHRVRYPNVERGWTTQDYHDVHFLSVALAYCDAVCPDRYWADAIRRSDFLRERGVAVYSGRNAIDQALSDLTSPT